MNRPAGPPDIAQPEAVLGYWFETLSPRDWFKHSARRDRDIAARFGATLDAAARCELWQWRAGARGRLAEIIVLDQFFRNVHRGDARAFANDALALALAQEAVARGVDRALGADERSFLYMPYMHSESLLVHAAAQTLFLQPGQEKTLEHERRHHAILKRFGRYPQRNAALGRTNTAAEAAFLDASGGAF